MMDAAQSQSTEPHAESQRSDPKRVEFGAAFPQLRSMAILDIKPANSCKYDLLALGEIMPRLDPGEGRVRTAREFKVWEGGGEYNVARGLSRGFGLETAVCAVFA